MSKIEVRPAGFWIRAAAFYLNVILFIVLLALVVIPFAGLNIIEYIKNPQMVELTHPSYYLYAALGMFFLSEVLLVGLTGFNVGKFILGIRVLDQRSFQPIGIRRAFLRLVIKVVAALPAGLGILALAFDKNKKGLHDISCGCCVIKDPKPAFHSIIRFPIALAMVLLFLATLIVTPIAIASSGMMVFNYFNHSTQIALVESELLDKNPKATISIPITEDKLEACLSINGEDYHHSSFIIDDREDNYISEELLKELNVEITDRNFAIDKNKDEWSVNQTVYSPDFTILDQNDKETIVRNLSFIINKEENTIGKDFLNLFTHKVDAINSKLALSLPKEEQGILSKKDLSKNEKDYLSHVIRNIRTNWQEAALPLEIKEELGKSKQKLINKVSITYEANRGYITAIKFLKPSTNQQFNEFCQEFIKSLPRVKSIPKELKEKKNFTLDYELTLPRI